MRYRNRYLNIDLDAAYRDFCGIGLHEVKERLRTDATPLALAYLKAIEIECFNRRAKRKMGLDSAAQLYRKKRNAIAGFVEFCLKHDYQLYRASAHQAGQPDVLYAYLPGCEQISWHCKLDDRFPLPSHPGDWDGKKYSTLRKLEKGVGSVFSFQ